MPIDDPISTLQALDDSDERQRSPVFRRAEQFLTIVRLFALPNLNGIDAALVCLSQRRQENLQQFVNVIATEMKYRGSQIELLISESDEHRRFIADEMPGLVLDGMRRAEEVRAKERIRRLGRILVHAAEVGPRDGADHAEEVMRVAVDLTERDLAVLRAMQSAHPLRITGPAQERYMRLNAAAIFERIEWRKLGFSEQELESTCCKLQSFGLVGRLDAGVKPYGPLDGQRSAYELLRKGWDFVEYIRSAAESGEPHVHQNAGNEADAPSV